MRRYSEAFKADVWRAHPPPHISLNSLAVTTHWSCPQASGCTNERGDNFPETGGTLDAYCSELAAMVLLEQP
jgi:hypothetical protein